jgi:hypothetical protein
MKWKEGLLSLVGVVLLWVFMIGGGFILNLTEHYPQVWLLLVFVIVPWILRKAPKWYRNKKKS